MPESKYYADINAETVDRWVANGWEWGVPVSHDEYAKALGGEWNVLLTPTIFVPKKWFAPFYCNGRLENANILGLACGGGQQMPIFAAAGAQCTVLDYSPSQLENERLVACREGYSIDIVRADMTKALPFSGSSFDMIFHPVSNCYIEDVCHVWRECFRILKPGGVLLAGMANEINYLFDEESNQPLTLRNKMPFNPLKDPALMEECMRTDSGVQFSHSLEEQIGGQLLAGFRLTDLLEDRNGSGLLREYCSQFILTRAVKC